MEQMIALSESLRREYEALKVYRTALDTVGQVEAPSDFLERVNERIDQPPLVTRVARVLFQPFHVKMPMEVAGLAVAALLIVLLYVPLDIRKAPRVEFHKTEKGRVVRLVEDVAKEQESDDVADTGHAVRKKARCPAGARKTGSAGASRMARANFAAKDGRERETVFSAPAPVSEAPADMGSDAVDNLVGRLGVAGMGKHDKTMMLSRAVAAGSLKARFGSKDAVPMYSLVVAPRSPARPVAPTEVGSAKEARDEDAETTKSRRGVMRLEKRASVERPARAKATGRQPFAPAAMESADLPFQVDVSPEPVGNERERVATRVERGVRAMDGSCSIVDQDGSTITYEIVLPETRLREFLDELGNLGQLADNGIAPVPAGDDRVSFRLTVTAE